MFSWVFSSLVLEHLHQGYKLHKNVRATYWCVYYPEYRCVLRASLSHLVIREISYEVPEFTLVEGGLEFVVFEHFETNLLVDSHLRIPSSSSEHGCERLQNTYVNFGGGDECQLGGSEFTSLNTVMR